ncbi:MAG: FtsB family cell division protein [Candidatus Kapaibacterium sp.]
MINYFKKITENKKSRFYLSVAAVLVIILFFFLFSSHGLIKRVSLESEMSDIMDDISTERIIHDSLKQRIKMLQKDTSEIERVAREKYGMVKPGEKVYILKENEK